jgi:hypothetical protein
MLYFQEAGNAVMSDGAVLEKWIKKLRRDEPKWAKQVEHMPSLMAAWTKVQTAGSLQAFLDNPPKKGGLDFAAGGTSKSRKRAGDSAQQPKGKKQARDEQEMDNGMPFNL